MNEGEQPGRWEMLRDLAVFQVKLAVDGFRDLLLSPLSLIAGLIGGLLLGNRRLFYRLVQAGRRTEKWIDLFGVADKLPPPEGEPPSPAHGSPSPADGSPSSPAGRNESPRLDDVIDRIEGLLAEQVRQGGMTRGARDAIDRALNRSRAKTASAAADAVPEVPGEPRGPGEPEGPEAPERPGDAATPDDTARN